MSTFDWINTAFVWSCAIGSLIGARIAVRNRRAAERARQARPPYIWDLSFLNAKTERELRDELHRHLRDELRRNRGGGRDA